ncbi:FlgD immunoglobulin-like domain containing protein [Streptomyces sp. NPDC048717]|uniref:FlgD immunoglobulin-like domain containing protein n=1 Tax=Streptomyces sp. NPDC048717 TaxID=3154928 RepID=UPI00341406B6
MAAATLIAGLGSFAPLAAAAGNADVVFPAVVADQPRQVIPVAAGESGFLRYEQGLGHFWTPYSGPEQPLSYDAEGPEADGTYGAGSDYIASLDANAPGGGWVRLLNVAANTARTVPLPSGYRYVGAFGTTVVATTQSAEDAPLVWHLLRSASSSAPVEDTVVTGWPDGAEPAAKAVTGDTKGILAGYTAGGVTRPVWIDLATAKVRPIAPDSTTPSAGTAHTATEVAEWTKDGVVHFYAKDAVGGAGGSGGADASGPLGETASAELAYHEGDLLLGVVGERLIVARVSGKGGSAPYRVVSVPRAGGEETELLAYGRENALRTTDGGLLVVGGTTADRLAVTRISATADGTALTALTDVTPLHSKARSLSFDHGRIASLDRMPDETNAVRSRTVSVSGPLAAGETEPRGDLGLALDHCADSSCDAPFTAGDGRMVINQPWGVDPSPAIVVDKGASKGRPISDEFTTFRVADVSGRYALGAGELKTTGRTRTAVIDLDTGEQLATPVNGYKSEYLDLYGDTVWSPGAGGTVIGYDARTGTVKRTVTVKAGCGAPENVRVTAHWLGWECSIGSSWYSGIYDLDTNTNRSYSGLYSVLGDGYVVKSSDDLVVTDIRGAQPVEKGTHHPSNFNFEEGVWAVDTATGRLAYESNRDGDLTVADLGVPASPLARVDADVPASATVSGDTVSWQPRWWLSKPAASWTLTVTDKSTGQPVRTLTGGEARGMLAAAWDGKDGTGQQAAAGSYAWTLTAKAADGSGADLEQHGELRVG